MKQTVIPIEAIRIIHDRQISRHGGAPGLRDAVALEKGCTRPISLAAHDYPDQFDIAAAYAFGIVKADAFVDGNKRTAFVAALTFLRMRGVALRPPTRSGIRMMEDLAAKRVSESAFASWLRSLTV